MGGRRAARRGRRSSGPRSTGTCGTTAVAAGSCSPTRLHGARPAAVPALDLLEPGQGPPLRREGTAAEDEALADLLMSDELRAGLYSFDLVQQRAKRPAGAPDRALARRSPRSASSAPG